MCPIHLHNNWNTVGKCYKQDSALSDLLWSADLELNYIPTLVWKSKLYPLPEARVLLQNGGVSFTWCIPGPTQNKSKNYNLLCNATNEWKGNLSYKEKEVQDLWTRRFKGLTHKLMIGTIHRRTDSRMLPNQRGWFTVYKQRNKNG